MALPKVLVSPNGCFGGHVGYIGQSSRGLRGLWRPEDLPASGACSVWPDASGHGHDFETDAASSTDPNVDTSTTLNGYRSLKFTPNVARDSMSAPGTSIFASCVEAASVFFLIRRHTSASNGATAGAPLVSELADAGGCHWPFTDGKTYDRNLRDRNHRVNNILGLGSWVNSTILIQISSSVDDGYKFRGNGGVLASTDHQWVRVTLSGGSNVMDQFQIGGNDANGFFGHPANYWEIIAYNAVPTDAERFEIHDYFNTKYGLSLPTS